MLVGIILLPTPASGSPSEQPNFTNQVQITQFPINAQTGEGINHIGFHRDGRAMAVSALSTHSFN